MGDDLFPLQVFLKEKTKIRVMHFPSTISPSEKLRDLKILYNELLAPTGREQRSETISEQEIDGEDEEEQGKHVFAKEFLAYAEQVGAEAMAILMHDRQSTIFISTHPEAASQNREDMLFALRRTYPALHTAKSTEKMVSLIPGHGPTEEVHLSPSLPFFVRFQVWSQNNTHIRFYHLIKRGYHTDVVLLIEKLEDRVLRRSKKYIFIASAFLMHEDVHQPQQSEWIEPPENRWIEFYESKDTPYGQQIRAVYLERGYPETEIALVSEQGNASLLNGMYRPYTSQWTILIITDPPGILYHFIYDPNEKRYCYRDQWRCPTQTCIPIEHDERDLLAEAFVPCASCQQATRYWSAWLTTTMRMIRGDYALSPEPPSFKETTISYEEEMLQIVGKGKNRRRVKGKKQREIEYTVISYDVSVEKQEVQRETTTNEKRVNWLSTTPKEQIIYERRHIEPFERHYIKKAGTYIVKPDGGYHRYVPLLKREPKTAAIVKITARKYEDTGQKS